MKKKKKNNRQALPKQTENGIPGGSANAEWERFDTGTENGNSALAVGGERIADNAAGSYARVDPHSAVAEDDLALPLAERGVPPTGESTALPEKEDKRDDSTKAAFPPNSGTASPAADTEKEQNASEESPDPPKSRKKHTGCFSTDYKENAEKMAALLRADESFDLIRRTLKIGSDEMTLFYIDGFVKDGEMQRIMQYFFSLKGLGSGADAAENFKDSHIPYVEVDLIRKPEDAVTWVLSGAVLLFGSTFGDTAVIIDARTYPARSTEEPDNDRVMQGAHDGFVETLIFNTALIRRRIRDPRLTMHYTNIGGISRTDIVLCYMEGVADPKYVKYLEEKLKNARPRSLTLGFQSLTECLVKKKWYNPFPKFRMLERPDAAAAELCEGRVLVLCDTTPQALVLPTSIFDFLQETDDYYFPMITGSYLRIVRHITFSLALILTPLWYLLIGYGTALPPALWFIIPEPGPIPVLLQLFLVEFAIDSLKLASMNTPSMLTNSLSVIGGLILGDFAVSIGWLSEEVILYMAIVAIAGFTQQNHELGYAFKFLRIGLLILTAIFGLWGFIAGIILSILLLATNETVNGKRSYLYPLIPFNGSALFRLVFRVKKHDFEEK